MGKVIDSIVIPTGWHYMEGATRIDAPTYEDLHPAVAHYRVMNGIALGDVAKDIEDQICARFPQNCRSGEVISSNVKIQQTYGKTPMSILLDSVSSWLREQLKQSTASVSANVAEQRAQICYSCPMHVKYSGCPDCVADVECGGARLRNAQDTTHTRRLGGCRSWRIDARSACFLERQHLPQTPYIDPPSPCWVLSQ